MKKYEKIYCHICGEELELDSPIAREYETCGMCQELGHVREIDTENCELCQKIRKELSYKNLWTKTESSQEVDAYLD